MCPTARSTRRSGDTSVASNACRSKPARRAGRRSVARTLPVRSLDGDVTADWLIIGAGFAGLSAARRLPSSGPARGSSCSMRREVAQGPAGRNSGFMIDVPHNLASGEYSAGDASAGEAGDGPQPLRHRLRRRGGGRIRNVARDLRSLAARSTRPRLRAAMKLNATSARSLERMGEPFASSTPAEMREMTGTDYYLGGLYTPGAVMIQPADYIRDLRGGPRRRSRHLRELAGGRASSGRAELWAARDAARHRQGAQRSSWASTAMSRTSVTSAAG